MNRQYLNPKGCLYVCDRGERYCNLVHITFLDTITLLWCQKGKLVTSFVYSRHHSWIKVDKCLIWRCIHITCLSNSCFILNIKVVKLSGENSTNWENRSNTQWKLKVQIGMKNNFWLKLDSNLWRLEFPQLDALTIEPQS